MAKVRGMRGKFTPMKTATPEQAASVTSIVEAAKTDPDTFLVEVRYPAYIGAGCAADRQAIMVVRNGAIFRIVEADGYAH